MERFQGRFIRASAIIWIAVSAVASFKVIYDSMMIHQVNPFNSVGDMFSIVMFFIIAISLTLIVSIVGFVAVGIVFQSINKTLIDRK